MTTDERQRFSIGQEVWYASWEATEDRVECPDCAGQGRIRVLLPDDTMVSVDCRGCERGYLGPQGYLVVYNRAARATRTTVTGLDIRDDKAEWHTADSRYVDDANIFDNEVNCRARATALAAEADKAERDRIAQKEKPTRTWAWNAHYHRAEIKRAQKQIEYHTAKLNVANLKAREDKSARAALIAEQREVKS